MNKTEFAALPPDLQRDVRCAVACGWPLKNVLYGSLGILVIDPRLSRTVASRWKPTTDRTIWAGLLEAFPMLILPDKPNKKIIACFGDSWAGTANDHLPTAIVLEVIRRDPLGHLKRSGL